MSPFFRPALAGIVGASVLAATGCASLPGEPANLQPYNGEWVLQAEDRSPEFQFIASGGSGFQRGNMQRLAEKLDIRTERFALALNDSIFRVSGDGSGLSFLLPVDGTPIEIHDEDGEVRGSMRLTWSGGTPVVRQTLLDAGWISDRYELTEDDVLVIKRRAGLRDTAGRDMEATGSFELAYIRSTGSGF